MRFAARSEAWRQAIDGRLIDVKSFLDRFAFGWRSRYFDWRIAIGVFMALWDRLTNWFTRGGRDENRLRQAMAHAHAKSPSKAIAIYDALVSAKRTNAPTRAKALFNRALAHSSLKDDAKAMADLEAVIALPGAPEVVLSAARNQLVRVRQRLQRVSSRSETQAASQSR